MCRFVCLFGCLFVVVYYSFAYLCEVFICKLVLMCVFVFLLEKVTLFPFKCSPFLFFCFPFFPFFQLFCFFSSRPFLSPFFVPVFPGFFLRSFLLSPFPFTFSCFLSLLLSLFCLLSIGRRTKHTIWCRCCQAQLRALRERLRAAERAAAEGGSRSLPRLRQGLHQAVQVRVAAVVLWVPGAGCFTSRSRPRKMRL